MLKSTCYCLILCVPPLSSEQDTYQQLTWNFVPLSDAHHVVSTLCSFTEKEINS